MTSEKTNPALDGLPAAGFANLEYGEFSDVVLQGLLPRVHTQPEEQSHAKPFSVF